MVPTEVEFTFVNVREALPSAAGSLLMVTAGLLLVTVTVIGLGGAAASVMLRLTCSSRPTVTSLIVIAGSVTVAVIDWRLLGVLKPAGVATLIVELPVAAGLNARAKLTDSPAVNTAGLPTIVPTVVFELDTTTFTDDGPARPPRSSCVAW